MCFINVSGSFPDGTVSQHLCHGVSTSIPAYHPRTRVSVLSMAPILQGFHQSSLRSYQALPLLKPWIRSSCSLGSFIFSRYSLSHGCGPNRLCNDRIKTLCQFHCLLSEFPPFLLGADSSASFCQADHLLSWSPAVARFCPFPSLSFSPNSSLLQYPAHPLSHSSQPGLQSHKRRDFIQSLYLHSSTVCMEAVCVFSNQHISNFPLQEPL